MSAVDPAQPPGGPRFRSGLGLRLLTAAAGIPLLLGAIWLGGILWALVVAAALALAVVEFTRAFAVTAAPVRAVAVLTGAALPLAALHEPRSVLAVLAAGTAAGFVALVAAGEAPPSLDGWAYSLAAVLYAGVLGQFAVQLRGLADGRSWLLLAVFTTFATDTGAYAVGRLIGRHKLAPRLSPGKTVEGAVGGLVGGALAAWALGAVTGLDQPAALLLALGLGAAVAAQVGDLAESLLKRTAGIKDMGSLFPGHGGVLDRLDSLLFVIPLVTVVAQARGA